MTWASRTYSAGVLLPCSATPNSTAGTPATAYATTWRSRRYRVSKRPFIAADDHHILGPRPEPTRNEHARLDRETHSPHQPTSIAAVEIRRLVDVQPDAMPETVAEPFAVAAVGRWNEQEPPNRLVRVQCDRLAPRLLFGHHVPVSHQHDHARAARWYGRTADLIRPRSGRLNNLRPSAVATPIAEHWR